MNKLSITILLLSLLITTSPGIALAEHVINESKNPEILIVVSGSSGTYSKDTLTLNSVPNVVYFSDRPGRVSGHVSLSDFKGIWNDSLNNFAQDPPNAALSILSDESANNAVIELLSAEVKEDSISFKIKILQGKVPKSFGPSSIFIDGDPYGSVFGATDIE